MNVSLTPQLEAFVEAKLATGRYQTASEVVRDALRLLEEQDHLRAVQIDELRKQIAVGLDQLDRGQRSPFDEAAAERIKASGRSRPRPGPKTKSKKPGK